jgi:hypothetical protein
MLQRSGLFELDPVQHLLEVLAGDKLARSHALRGNGRGMLCVDFSPPACFTTLSRYAGEYCCIL